MRRRRLRLLVLVPTVLAAAVLAAAPASAGGGCHAPATEGRGTTVALVDLCFTPTVLRVAPGAEVTFVNRDSIQHPLARPGGAWDWAGTAGGRTTVRLDRSGTYPFFCYLHPGMVGVVVVGDGQSPGGPLVEVEEATAALAGSGPAGQPTTAAAPDGTAASTFPVTWLVPVALAALVGAAAGARIRGRRPA